MAKFTQVDDKTEVSQATIHVGGSKRPHLADVGADKKVLAVLSTGVSVVNATLVAVYSGPKGIWTVDLGAKAKGDAEVQAKLKEAVVAKVAVTVEDPVELPAVSSEEGLLARLPLAENRTPAKADYDVDKS